MLQRGQLGAPPYLDDVFDVTEFLTLPDENETGDDSEFLFSPLGVALAGVFPSAAGRGVTGVESIESVPAPEPNPYPFGPNKRP